MGLDASTIGSQGTGVARRSRTFSFNCLDQHQINELHQASLEIMGRTGMRFYDQNALDIFKKAGVKITDGNKVHIPPKLVERALSTVPKSLMIYDRNGQQAMHLEGNHCYYGSGSDCAYIYDLHTGEHRKAVLADVIDGVRLTDALPNMDYTMSMYLPSDVPQDQYENHQMAVMLKESTKPILFAGLKPQSTVDAIEMASIVAGGEEQLIDKPFVVNYVCIFTPLHHDKESIQRLIYAAERNLPTIFIPGGTCGSSAPITLAGSIAMRNASQLGGLVLSQLIKEGSPFIVGAPRCEYMDMRTLFYLYAPPDAGPYAWDLAHHYGMPTFTTACSDSKIFDAQAAAETALTLFEKTMNWANIIHDCGYLNSAMTNCLELVVFSDEVIDWIKCYFQPLEINPETLALDLVDEMGPDGSYLASQHTLNHFREIWNPKLMDRSGYENWAADGGKTLQQRANERARELIESHRAESLPGPVIKKLDQIVMCP